MLLLHEVQQQSLEEIQAHINHMRCASTSTVPRVAAGPISVWVQSSRAAVVANDVLFMTGSADGGSCLYPNCIIKAREDFRSSYATKSSRFVSHALTTASIFYSQHGNVCQGSCPGHCSLKVDSMDNCWWLNSNSTSSLESTDVDLIMKEEFSRGADHPASRRLPRLLRLTHPPTHRLKETSGSHSRGLGFLARMDKIQR